MFRPSGSGRAAGGAAGGRGKGDGPAAWPGAVPGVADALWCGGGTRGRSEAERAVQGLAVSAGAVMSGADTAADATDDLFPAAAAPAPAAPLGSLDVRRLPGWPATKRICGYMPGLPSAARPGKLAGQAFTGQPSDHLDLRIRADRARQRRAAVMHASQS
jgi:hypothetical protein